MEFLEANQLHRKYGLWGTRHSLRIEISTGLSLTQGVCEKFSLSADRKHRRERPASGLNREVNVCAGVSSTEECRFEL